MLAPRQAARDAARGRIMTESRPDRAVGARPPLTLDYYPPSAELQPFVTTLYCLCSEAAELADAMPAGVGYLLVFLTGTGSVEFADGRVDPSHPVSLITPTTAAIRVRLAGPVCIVGAALSPLGWAAITGLPAHRWRDRFADAAAMLGSDWAALGERLRAAYDAGVTDPADAVAAIGAFLAAHRKPLNPRHAEMVGAVVVWLSSSFDPPLAELEARTGYSGRHLQRLVERYFGAPPKVLLRKYRALRVAALLRAPDTSDEQIAELLNLFYDQSHLIRELRHFLGRTPARLGDPNSPLLNAVSDLRNFRDLTPNVARIPGD